jgi:hypothetical protein
MGVNVDRNVVPLGDRMNRKQSIVMVPAQNVANKPGILNLQSVSGTTVTDVFIWPNTSGVLRYGSTIPTAVDSDGTAVGSGATGADTALSNLAAVAINAGLIADSNNDTDLGSNTYSWRSAYIGTSLVFKEATANATVVAADHAVARTYTFPDAGAAATIMLNTGAANAVIFTNGTSNITIGAAGVIDVAAAKTVNIDQNFTVNTEAVTLDQSLSTTDAVAFATGSSIGNLTLANGSITDSGGAISFGNENLTTTGTINVDNDNTDITLGLDGATDSRIFFDGAGNLKFYDSNMGASRSLTELYTGTTLNPSVSGDLSITDGKFTWTNATNEASAVWTFANTTAIDIAVASALTSGTALSITADSCANGKLLVLDSDGDVGASGYYIYALDGTNPMFTVGADGTTAIAGTAGGTAALTVSLGDAVVTSGKLLVTSAADLTSKFTRNVTTLTSAMVEIEQGHASGGVGLLVDQKATGDLNAIEITHAGTGYAVTVSGVAATGGYEYISAASGTGAGLLLDGSTGTAAWTGANDTGFAIIQSDGILAAGANLLRVSSTGANTAASHLVEVVSTGAATGSSNGTCLYLEDTGTPAAGTTYALAISATQTGGEALNVLAGKSLFAETVTITCGDSSGGALAITNPDTTGNSNAVSITPSGSGAGLVITTQEADTKAISVVGKTASTVSLVKIDGTPTDGWYGAANIGMLHLVNDGIQADAAASQLYIGYSGTGVADSRGSAIRIVDTSTPAGTMGYPVYVSSVDAQVGGIYISTEATATALNVAAGVSTFAGKATFAGGLTTKVGTNDIHDTVPTNANIEAAFGTAAAAGAGFVGLINDGNLNANVWLMYSSGTSWFYLPVGTKAT